MPTFVRYDAGDWGVGELWLDGNTLVASHLPRPGVVLLDDERVGAAPGRGSVWDGFRRACRVPLAPVLVEPVSHKVK